MYPIDGSVTLTQEECAIILANVLLSLWERDRSSSLWEAHLIPSVNFDELFTASRLAGARVAKMQMIFNYFKRLSEKSLLYLGLIFFTGVKFNFW